MLIISVLVVKVGALIAVEVELAVAIRMDVVTMKNLIYVSMIQFLQNLREAVEIPIPLSLLITVIASRPDCSLMKLTGLGIIIHRSIVLYMKISSGTYVV